MSVPVKPSGRKVFSALISNRYQPFPFKGNLNVKKNSELLCKKMPNTGKRLYKLKKYSSQEAHACRICTVRQLERRSVTDIGYCILKRSGFILKNLKAIS